MITEQFKAYEQTGQYVFHGSLYGEITEFEPRQALSFNKPDGDPAIFACENCDPAIFMAILGSRRVAGWDSDKFIPPLVFLSPVHIGKPPSKRTGKAMFMHYLGINLSRVMVGFGALPN